MGWKQIQRKARTCTFCLPHKLVLRLELRLFFVQDRGHDSVTPRERLASGQEIAGKVVG